MRRRILCLSLSLSASGVAKGSQEARSDGCSAETVYQGFPGPKRGRRLLQADPTHSDCSRRSRLVISAFCRLAVASKLVALRDVLFDVLDRLGV